jgi:uncharacterized protein YecE (DUF72 family)
LQKDRLSTLVRQAEVALVLDDSAAFEDITADFFYTRLRHCSLDEPAGYPADALDLWAQRLRQWSAQGACDGFVYFISGAKVRAPAAAQALLQRLAETA